MTAPEYLLFIKGLIEKHFIELYAPLIDEEIEVAHKLLAEIPTLHLLSPKLSFCTLAMKKDLLMEELRKHEISVIHSWTGNNFKWQKDKVFFVKPISGRGSRGIRKIATPEELEAYYVLEKYDPSDLLVQENVEGEEYTVGALINKHDDILYISCRKILKKKGITIKAVTENNALIEAVVAKINAIMQPKGPINIQLYITPEKEIKIFEINPRFSTTTVMSYEAGIDEIGLWFKYADNKYDGEIVRPREKLVLHRRWENVFYDQR